MSSFIPTLTLRRWMVSESYAYSEDSTKVRCPFHNDKTPSAYLNDNSVYCWTCGLLYNLSDVENKFNVLLSWDTNEATRGSIIESTENCGDKTGALFVYDFMKGEKE